MKLTYKELEIELELAGLLAVEELVLTQGLNCHAGLTLKILIEEEQRDELVTMSSDAGVTVRELEKTNGQVVFRGKLETVSARRENGLFYLYLEAWSYTMDWDRVKKSRSFQNGALTYMEVVQRVLSGYGQSGVTDHATGGACIPEFLLQYEESDWVFCAVWQATLEHTFLRMPRTPAERCILASRRSLMAQFLTGRATRWRRICSIMRACWKRRVCFPRRLPAGM